MGALTEFGNAVLLIALSLAIAAWLVTNRRVKAAFVWLAAVVTLIGSMAFLKIYFSACHLYPFRVHSPSGHVGFSTLVYGGLCLILGVGRSLWQRELMAGSVAVWISLIAISRVVLHAHTVSEVIVGAGIGGAILWTFAQYYLRTRPTIITPGKRDLFLFAAIIVATHGSRLGIEMFLWKIGGAVHHHIWCP